MKKALMLASVMSTIGQFNMDNMCILRKSGYEVDAVANLGKANPTSRERIQTMQKAMENEGITVIHMPLPRKITDIKGIFISYKSVKKLCDANAYEILHCHSPIGSVIARLAARKARKKYKTRVIYTAHGFHFFKGAPFLNWLLYFPIEWICAFWTDTLITINKEDFARAKRWLHAKNIKYIPGVGIDTEEINSVTIDRSEKRKALGIKENEIAVLSVGELNDNKNHETIIRAIAKLPEAKLVYLICGKGQKEAYLRSLAEELGVKLVLCGFRDDVVEICKACDIFAFPSKREGLSVALMEAMAAGLPCLVSAIRGNKDLIQEGEGGFLCQPQDVHSFAEKLKLLSEDETLRMHFALCNRENALHYDRKIISEKMKAVYQ